MFTTVHGQYQSNPLKAASKLSCKRVSQAQPKNDMIWPTGQSRLKEGVIGKNYNTVTAQDNHSTNDSVVPAHRAANTLHSIQRGAPKSTNTPLTNNVKQTQRPPYFAPGQTNTNIRTSPLVVGQINSPPPKLMSLRFDHPPTSQTSPRRTLLPGPNIPPMPGHRSNTQKYYFFICRASVKITFYWKDRYPYQ